MKRRIVAALGFLVIAAAVAAPARGVRAQGGPPNGQANAQTSGPSSAAAPAGEDLAVQAREAFRIKDKAQLFRLRQAAAAQEHPLASWVDYWELGVRLTEVAPADFNAFAERWRGTYVEDRMRNDWLLELGRRREWALVRAEFARFRMNDDREVTCYHLLATHLEGLQDVRIAARHAWLAQRDSDDGCMLLAQTLFEQRVFGADELWHGLRAATEANRPRLARERAALADANLAAQIDMVFKDPARVLRDKRGAKSDTSHQLAVLALWRLAAAEPDSAVTHLEQHEANRLPAAELARAWAGVARQAAMKQHARAAEFARRAFAAWDAATPRGRPALVKVNATVGGAADTPATPATPATAGQPAASAPAADAAAAAAPTAPTAPAGPSTPAASAAAAPAAPAAATSAPPASPSSAPPAAAPPTPQPPAGVPPAPRRAQEQAFSDDTLGWLVRAALRSTERQRWALVLRAIDEMSPSEQRDATWVYWRARALRGGAPAGPEGEGARALARITLESIAGPLGFYNQLALEDLGQRVRLPAAPVPLVQSEREPLRQHAGLQRALRLMQVGLRQEGVREWNYSLRGMNDRELLATAAIACEREVWDRCINTSERTRDVADISQRYPLPFRDAVVAQSREAGLDPAYVFGLIRQESRFILDARSHVGASGLMQLMPATARWTARRAGIADWKPEQVNDRDTNLLLGTTYLKLVLDEFGGAQALAAAAYNAGPSRPRRWREGPPVETAAWVEGIPFNETRDYVKKVLSNAVVYAARLGAPPAPPPPAGATAQAASAPAATPAGAPGAVSFTSLRARLGPSVGPRDPAAPAENRELP